MARLFLTTTTLLHSSIALAQTLNNWPRHMFTNSDALNDGNTTTFFEESLPTYDAFLFNTWEELAGFYIQSSGAFITDYYVTATVNWPLTELIRVGQVCGATSNFTAVLFTDDKRKPSVFSDTYFLQVTGSRGNTSIINEVWPIYPGDTIFSPNNTSPCPAPSATPTSGMKLHL